MGWTLSAAHVVEFGPTTIYKKKKFEPTTNPKTKPG
jgi:hypothetical protein